MSLDRNKSLQELEAQDWGDPAYDSHLVTECHRLRRVPLRELTAENLRIMIGQQIGLPQLIPLALELLSGDPFAPGDFYRGDLLAEPIHVFGSRPRRCGRKQRELLNGRFPCFQVWTKLTERQHRIH